MGRVLWGREHGCASPLRTSVEATTGMWIDDRIASYQRAVRRFLREREFECVRASENFHRCLLNPELRGFCSIYIHLREGQSLSLGRVDGLAVQDPEGVLYVLLPDSRQNDIELATRLSLQENVLRVAGMRQDVRRLVSALGKGEWQDQSYMLMRACGVDIPFVLAQEGAVLSGGESVRIRDATEDDLDTLLSLHRAYEREELNLESSRAETALRIRWLLERQVVAMAFRGDEPVGKINTNARGSFYDQIGGFYVKPEYRSMGIGSALLFHLLREITAARRNPVLFVRQENVPAIKVYRRAGFRSSGEYAMSTKSPTRRLP